MQDKIVFDPEKITIVDFKIIKGQIDTPEDFDIDQAQGHQIENSLQLGFNIEEKLAKADFNIEIKTESKGANKIEAIGIFHLVFIYKIENLEQMAILDKNNMVDLDPNLSNALSSITYSTARGILLTRFQGTALQNFILPVINPNKLLHNK